MMAAIVPKRWISRGVDGQGKGAPRRATSVAPRGGETCVAEGVDEVSREAAAVRAGEVVVPGS